MTEDDRKHLLLHNEALLLEIKKVKEERDAALREAEKLRAELPGGDAQAVIDSGPPWPCPAIDRAIHLLDGYLRRFPLAHTPREIVIACSYLRGPDVRGRLSPAARALSKDNSNE